MNTERKPAIGFIGLGHMGSRMAARLLDSGYALTVYNRTPLAAKPLVERGASASCSPLAVAKTSAVVLLSVADDAALENVMRGPRGVLAGLHEGAIVIDCSTVSPRVSRGIAQEVAARACAMLDAPVSGSTPQAEQGSLNILVGGDEYVYRRCRPIFDALGTSYHLGPNGTGLVMKLVVNSLLGLGVQALAEAITLGQAAGLETNQFLEVLGRMAVISPAQLSKIENARTGHYPAAFPLQHMNKDYGLIAELATAAHVPMPAMAAARQMSLAAHAQGMGEDFSAVIHLMQQLAGLHLTADGTSSRLHETSPR
ncbi:MAG TPA: NAD(P)-dependent oxidoreductase [Chloroflexota bacterium]